MDGRGRWGAVLLGLGLDEVEDIGGVALMRRRLVLRDVDVVVGEVPSETGTGTKIGIGTDPGTGRETETETWTEIDASHPRVEGLLVVELLLLPEVEDGVAVVAEPVAQGLVLFPVLVPGLLHHIDDGDKRAFRS